MRNAIDNLQPLYQSYGRVFSGRLVIYRMYLVVLVDETLNVNHQLSARRAAVVRRWIVIIANEVTRSLPTSRHGGSRYAPRENVIHRASTQMDVVGTGISTPNRLLELEAEATHLQLPLHNLRDSVEQTRQERLSLEASVQRYRLHRSDDR